MGARATAAELELRIEAIRRAILEGRDYRAIVRFSAENWKITSRQVDDYIAAARKSIREATTAARDELVAEHIEIRRELRRRMIADDDYRGALTAAQDEAKLLDLYPAAKEKTELAGDVRITVVYEDASDTDDDDDDK